MMNTYHSTHNSRATTATGLQGTGFEASFTYGHRSWRSALVMETFVVHWYNDGSRPSPRNELIAVNIPIVFLFLLQVVLAACV